MPFLMLKLGDKMTYDDPREFRKYMYRSVFSLVSPSCLQVIKEGMIQPLLQH